MPHSQRSLTVPAEALIFNAGGTQIATVGKDDLVHLHHVTILRDHGTTLDLSSGLAVGEAVVVNPFAGMAEGQRVTPQPNEPNKAAAN